MECDMKENREAAEALTTTNLKEYRNKYINLNIIIILLLLL
jgi:hypothetical protein